MVELARSSVERKTRWVKNFPAEGIHFADLTPVLADAEAFNSIIKLVSQWAEGADVVAGLDARGFLIASGVASNNGVGVLAVRKSGKLPPPVHSVEYELEYGTAALEIPAEGIDLADKKVFIADEVLATGGTAKAAVDLLKQAGAEITGFATILELEELAGRAQLSDVPVFSVATA